MYPELFKIGPFTVYSYGLMLGIAFIVGSYLLSKEFKRKKLNQNFATEITLLCIVFGIVGAKMFHLFENWNEFIADPIGMAFSAGGLTYYGGFLFATASIFIYIKRKKLNFLTVIDAAAPALAIAYGIGRIGCHLAGDGDYGTPTNLPWGTNYENGTVPPSYAFRGSELASSYPGGIVPDNTPLHPTPMYEFFAMLLIFWVLWKLKNRSWHKGKLFSLYLILAGTERFLVELLRLNPHLLFGLSEAQLISIPLIILGITGFFYFGSKTDQTVDIRSD